MTARYCLTLVLGVHLLCCLLPAPMADAQTAMPYPEGWEFRAAVTVQDKAGSCDLWLNHHGLAQPDARDVRVFAPDGTPVSHFVSFADAARARILFDGAPGPGRYTVCFGNLDESLPALPQNGLLLPGRADWKPEGGLTSLTYKGTRSVRELGPRMMSARQVVEMFERVAREAEAGQKKLDAAPEAEAGDEKKKPQPPPVPFVTRRIHPSADTQLPVDPGEWLIDPDGKRYHARDRFAHLFRAIIDVEQTDEYYFIVGLGDGHTANVKVLLVDGDLKDAAVKGWYRLSYGYSVHVGTGSARLAAGRRTLELYTNIQKPNIRFRVGSPTAAVHTLDGRIAHFDNTAGAALGEFEAASGPLADALSLIHI